MEGTHAKLEIEARVDFSEEAQAGGQRVWQTQGWWHTGLANPHGGTGSELCLPLFALTNLPFPASQADPITFFSYTSRA